MDQNTSRLDDVSAVHITGIHFKQSTE
uniref:Uncharacterized protein n=1 Tax=Arundo donax TaxID=35708 RepID=A0A0A8YLH5_ARUDO